jgi:lipopolysaccharide export system protein LptA
VRWSDGEGSLAETSRVFFHPGSRVLEAPETVHFTQGSLDLTAPSARYDLRERVLNLKGPIEGAGSGEESGGLSHLTAREGLYRRELGVLELDTVDGQSRTGDRFAADHLVVRMGPSGGHAEWARATGSVRGILGAAGAPAGPERSKRERQYAGEESILTLDADGKAKSFVLRGSPAVLWEPGRRLTAREIQVAFEEGRASSARAAGEVRVEGEGSHASADRGSLGFAPDGATENVALEGNVTLEGRGRRGQAFRAVEVGARQTWVLTGDAQKAARVESGGSRLSADRVEIDQDRGQVRGEGRARAVFVPDPRKNEHVTFVGDSKRPTYGKADRIALDDAHQLATLAGQATLWQDASSLSADDITLSDTEKTVTAVQNVRAHLTPAPRGASKGNDHAASVITAARLVYRDGDRTARFEGGVTMTRGSLKATGGESTAWLGTERDVDCVEITGDVSLDDRATGRTGKAEKAIDYPKQERTILWGSPARVSEAGGNRVSGAVLTILDRGRRVEITAPEGGKTETIHRTTND